MDAQSVETQNDFLAFAKQYAISAPAENSLPYTGYMVSLECYLRSLWAISLLHSQKDLTWALFAQLLQGTFQTPPAPINPSWDRHKRPNLSEKRADFEHLHAMIVYQIADLNYLNEIRTTGDVQLIRQVNSYIDQNWRNKSMLSFINTAVGYFNNYQKPNLPCSWHTMAVFLQVGQRYE